MRLALLAIVALLVVGPQSASAAACGPRDAGTLAESKRIRLFEVADARGRPVMKSCHVPTRRSFVLGVYNPSDRTEIAELFRFSGDWVAYVEERRIAGGNARGLRVIDARTGEERFNDDLVQSRRIVDWVLAPNGGVAWISSTSAYGKRYRALFAGGDGVRTRLDGAPGYAIRDLDLRGTRATWRNGKARRSAVLR